MNNKLRVNSLRLNYTNNYNNKFFPLKINYPNLLHINQYLKVLFTNSSNLSTTTLKKIYLKKNKKYKQRTNSFSILGQCFFIHNLNGLYIYFNYYLEETLYSNKNQKFLLKKK